MAVGLREIVRVKQPPHHFVFESLQFKQQLRILDVEVLAAAIAEVCTGLNAALFESHILENQEFTLVLIILVVEARLTGSLARLVVETVIVGSSVRALSAILLILPLLVEIPNFVENLEQLLLALVLDLCRFNDGDGSLAVDEVGGARPPSAFATDTGPCLFEVLLNKFQSVQRGHLVVPPWPVLLCSRRTARVVGGVLVGLLSG